MAFKRPSCSPHAPSDPCPPPCLGFEDTLTLEFSGEPPPAPTQVMEEARVPRESQTRRTHHRWRSSKSGPASWLLDSEESLLTPTPRCWGLDSVSLAGRPAAVRPEAAGNLAGLFWECDGARAAWQQLKFQPLWFPRWSPPL